MTEDQPSGALAGGRPSIGIAMPTNRVRLSGWTVRGLLAELNRAGCESLWVNDHLGAFASGSDAYPYSSSGDITWDPHQPQYEALTSCAFLAAAAGNMRIGTSVLVLPQRHPIEVAKAAATLADLAEGRFVLGVGVGWSRREMAMLGWDPATRGRRLDEQLALIRALWRDGKAAGESGSYAVPDDLIHEPRPHPGQRPPVLIGGMSRAAHDRVIRHGDGWLAVAPAAADALDGAGAALAGLRARTPRALAGVLKIALPEPDPAAAVRAVRQVRPHRWNDISFEFDRWDSDAACAVVAACRSALGEEPACPIDRSL
ncbi:TIGR03619 family F420-dependent LLM class oxidoreductase [Streptomyces sp. NPDC059352]|uniref:TIGR03619 family F420-dependent LLM class oxidoreductase n=1 Tax=Streptomyces sp. NPDC059352 TaxID=3346810 RepID=UPI0036BFD037